MKVIISSLSVILSVIGLPVAVINFANGRYLLGVILLAWFSFVIFSVGEWLVRQFKSAFTLIELIAVITIISFTLTIGFRIMHVDKAKSETITLTGQLKQATAESFNTPDIVPFILDPDKYSTDITFSHSELFFLRGLPVDVDGVPLIDCYYSITDGKSKPFKINIVTFTGRIKHY